MFLHVENENDDKMETLKRQNDEIVKKIENIENAITEMDEKIKESEDALQNEKNQAKKKNILERLADIENSNAEKVGTVNVLTIKFEKLEEKLEKLVM